MWRAACMQKPSKWQFSANLYFCSNYATMTFEKSFFFLIMPLLLSGKRTSSQYLISHVMHYKRYEGKDSETNWQGDWENDCFYCTLSSTQVSNTLLLLMEHNNPELVTQYVTSELSPRPHATSQNLLFLCSPKRAARPLITSVFDNYSRQAK